MSNSLKAYAQSGAIALSTEAMADAMEAAEQAMRSGGGSGDTDVEYVSFSGKSGQITFGRDKEDLDEDQQMLVDPRSFTVGWICWVSNTPVARHEWSIFEPRKAVRADELEDHGPYRRQQDGWQSAAGFGFIGADDGTKYKFSSNSKSGKNSISDLLSEIKARLRAGEPAFPLIRFTKEKFLAQGEWNYKPLFLIDEWLDEAEANDIVAGEEEDDTTDPEPEVVEEEAPRRTRRRA